jgi:hypothetical protein
MFVITGFSKQYDIYYIAKGPQLVWLQRPSSERESQGQSLTMLQWSCDLWDITKSDTYGECHNLYDYKDHPWRDVQGKKSRQAMWLGWWCDLWDIGEWHIWRLLQLVWLQRPFSERKSQWESLVMLLWSCDLWDITESDTYGECHNLCDYKDHLWREMSRENVPPWCVIRMILWPLGH